MNGGFQNAYKQRDVRILKLLQKNKQDWKNIFKAQYSIYFFAKSSIYPVIFCFNYHDSR